MGCSSTNRHVLGGVHQHHRVSRLPRQRLVVEHVTAGVIAVYVLCLLVNLYVYRHSIKAWGVQLCLSVETD